MILHIYIYIYIIIIIIIISIYYYYIYIYIYTFLLRLQGFKPSQAGGGLEAATVALTVAMALRRLGDGGQGAWRHSALVPQQ